MKKLHALKTFLKKAGGRMHTPHPTPLDSLLAIATETIKRIWHISVTWQLAPLVLFLFTDRQSQKRGAWHNSPAPKYAT